MPQTRVPASAPARAEPDELDGVLARFEATWGEGRGPDRSMVQAIDHAGNTVLVAVPAPPGEERGRRRMPRPRRSAQPSASSAGRTGSTCTRT